MMNVIAFLLGVLLPTASGTMAIVLMEGNRPVLFPLERIALGWVLGITYSMFVIFLIHITTQLPLALPLFAGMQILLLSGSGFMMHRQKKWAMLFAQREQRHEPQLPQWLRTTCKILFGLLVLKIAFTGMVFLLMTPSYLDDTLNNWNLRGKLYFEDQKLTLVLPSEDPAVSPKGVSSYPPALPLAKTWVSTIAGTWTDALANSIQIVWYVAALTLVFYAIRRHTSTAWAYIGLFMIGGMPLYLMQGTNAYADVFLSAHIFAAVSFLFTAVRSTDSDTRLSFFRLAAISTAILPFTKNEAMLVYLPPLILLVILSLWFLRTKMTLQMLRSIALWYIIPFVCIALPWLLFKWAHGLTFGNGKAFTALGFGWHEFVLTSIAINTFFEGNWILLFPLLFLLLLWRWKAATRSLVILSSFFLMVYIGQVFIYLFTDLATEALRQTGYARGLVQLTPVVVLLTVLLLQDSFPTLFIALAKKPKMATD